MSVFGGIESVNDFCVSRVGACSGTKFTVVGFIMEWRAIGL